jgi:hypothetical protein
MPGHSRSKDGVASLAHAPGIHVFAARRKTWMTGSSPAMTKGGVSAIAGRDEARYLAPPICITVAARG